MSGLAPSPGGGPEGVHRGWAGGVPPSWLVGVLALLLALSASWWWSRSGAAVADNVTPLPSAATPHEITAHVSGLVAHPGLVRIPADGRVADAIAAAGGMLPGADLTAVNLAAPVRDGERIVVADATAPEVATVTDDGKVHVNEADAPAIEALPGVGPVLAQRIVAFRTEHGPFGTVEDLLDVPGIGEGKLAAMRDLVAIP